MPWFLRSAENEEKNKRMDVPTRIAPLPQGVAHDVKVKITMKAAFRCGTQ